jgi:hypothetical protein
MSNDKQQSENQIEDLTVSETETENVKGGMYAAELLLKIEGVKGESRDSR